MIRSILVPVHSSPSAGPAMKTAARLAQLVKARLHAVFVVDPYRFLYVPLTSAVGSPLTGDIPMHAPLPPEDLMAEEDAVEDEERELRESFRRTCEKEGLQGDFRMLRGDVDATIVRCSRSVDLIVMGSRTDQGIPHPLVERVLRQSARPLLVVPAAGRFEGPALFAYDGSRAAQRALGIGGTLLSAGAFTAPHLLSVGKSSECREHLWDARQYLSAYVSEVTTHEAEGDAAQRILDLGETLKAGLIVMGAHGHSTLRTAIFGSTTSSVLEKAHCPVLFMT